MEAEREDEVRARAHAIWEREGRPEGGAERHWAQAEEGLRGEGDGARPHAIGEGGGRPGGGAGGHWARAGEGLRGEGAGRAEAPAVEAVRTAAEAERAAGPEGGAERQGPVAEEPQAGSRKRARQPAAEAAGRAG